MFTMTAHNRTKQTRHGLHLLRWFSRAFATKRQRARLEDLDEHLLQDIGIDRVTARREAIRPFWDLS